MILIFYLYLVYGVLVFIANKKAKLLIPKVVSNADNINIIDYGISVNMSVCAFPITVFLYNLIQFLLHCIENKPDSFYICNIIIFSLLLILIFYLLIKYEFMKIIILTDKSLIITSRKNKENNYIKEKIDLSQIQSVTYKSWGNKLTINHQNQGQIVLDDFTKLKKIYKYLNSVITE